MARGAKTVTLDPGRAATVQELRVRDVRRILEGLQDPALRESDLPTLLRERLPDLLALAGDAIVLPQGEALDDLTMSEVEAIGRAWWALHQRFFAPVVAAVQPYLHGLRLPAISTSPVSAASNADTPGSGTTAGASTSPSSMT